MIENLRESISLRRAAGASLVLAALLAGCASQPDAIQRKTGWMRAEVADSYIYAYPLVLMDVAKEAATGGDGAQPGQAPLNTLRHAQALPPVGALNPPLPGVDTLDSTGWLDVGAEPVIVTLPDTRGRYWDARALDMWTNVLWSSSSVAARGARGAAGSDKDGVAPEDGAGRGPQGARGGPAARRDRKRLPLPRRTGRARCRRAHCVSTCRRPTHGSKCGCRRAAGATSRT